jgi:preprotein translocase subunit YajC
MAFAGIVVSLSSVLMQCESAGQRGETSGGGGLLALWPIVLIFVIFYFLLIRPQQKRQKEHQRMMESIKKGDHILTSGGMHGTVVGVKDNIVVVKIAENVKVEFAKSAISHIFPGE